MTSPLLSVLNKIISGSEIANIDSKISIWSYKDEEHFYKLWNLLPNIQIDNTAGKCIFIVWDQTPIDETVSPVNTSKYLTPLDWAVCAKSGCKGLSVIILDLSPLANKETPTYKLHRDVNKSKLSWLKMLYAHDLLECGNLELYIENLVASGSSSFQTLEMFQREITFNLTTTAGDSNRHAISNLIGPRILMRNYAGGGHRQALSRLLTSIGLISEKKDLPKITPPESLVIPERTKFILFDDQWMHGWSEWLNFILGNSGQESQKEVNRPTQVGKNVLSDNSGLYVHNDPSYLLDKCQSLLLDESASLSILGHDTNEILLLDLRLFSDQPENERKFFRRIIRIISEYPSKLIIDDEHLESDMFLKSEIEHISKWCDNFDQDPTRYKNSIEKDEYRTALTLLPRLISILDHTLPIIIFSSTGRREISEAFKNYPNIITTFDKPRYFSGNSYDVAYESRNKLFIAINYALKILRVKNIISKILSFPASESPFTNKLPGCRHLEVYIDETEIKNDQNLYVGGLVFGYPDYQAVKTVHDALSKAGCCWYKAERKADCFHLSKRPSRPNDNRPTGEVSDVNWNYSNVLEKLENICSANNVTVIAFRVKDNETIYSSRHFPINNTASDSRYMHLLSYIIKILFYEYFVASTDNIDGISISLFPATRKQDIKLNNNFKWINSSETANDYFGFYEIEDTKKACAFVTVGEDAIAHFIDNILWHNGDIDSKFTVHHARAVRLRYGIGTTVSHYNKQSWDKFRNQHYYADHSVSKSNDELYKQYYAKGFDIDINSDIDMLLSASKNLDNNDIANGIHTLMRCNEDNQALFNHVLYKFKTKILEVDKATFYKIMDNLMIAPMDNKKEELDINEIKENKILCRNKYGDVVTISKKNMSGIRPSEQNKLSAEVYFSQNRLFAKRVELVLQTDSIPS